MLIGGVIAAHVDRDSLGPLYFFEVDEKYKDSQCLLQGTATLVGSIFSKGTAFNLADHSILFEEIQDTLNIFFGMTPEPRELQ